MTRTAGWIANAVLFTLCCFLIARTVDAIAAALLNPTAADPAPTAGSADPARYSWTDRRVILERNLFNSTTLAPPPPEEEPEDLEATRLPLDLLGTLASTDPDKSTASIRDRGTQDILIVRVNDEVLGKAKVLRIERRRIVLSENGSLRELAIDEDQSAAAPKPRARPRARARARRSSRRSASRQPRAQNAEPSAVSAALRRNPTQLFSQARIMPKYQGNDMVGVEITNIKEDSYFRHAGLVEHDVIQDLNGIPITTPEQTRSVLDEFSKADNLVLQVLRAGETITLNYTMPQE